MHNEFVSALPAEHPALALYDRVCKALDGESPEVSRGEGEVLFIWGTHRRRFKMGVRDDGLIRLELVVNRVPTVQGLGSASGAENWLHLFAPITRKNARARTPAVRKRN